jgi:gamma-glutamyltranspeptidase/glutathione hydrolase
MNDRRMTDRWLNYVLAVVVVTGLAGAAVYERPRLAEERAEFLDQEVVQLDDVVADPIERDPLELRRRAADSADDDSGDGGPDEVPEPTEPPLGVYGVSSASPEAVAVGMEVLAAGGNAVDATVAVAYALGVAEPFGSGPGGGGSMLVHPVGEDPVSYDYREIAPRDGGVPASNIGVPGFVAGMEHIHGRHGSIELADLIEPAARLAEDGIEVSQYLHERLRGAGYRLPIHLAPRLFPNGQPVAPGETLRQPEYAEALRVIQDGGADAFYRGPLAQLIVEAVGGLDAEDLAAYEVLEIEPVVGTFQGYDIVGAGVPSSGITVVQMLQIAEAMGVPDMDLDAADAYHAVAQAWRAALSDRTEYVTDPALHDVLVEELVSQERATTIAESIPDDGFVEVAKEEEALHLETDTTHVVVVDAEGTMVSMTNTLSNFFGSGLPVSGFFLNDQLKNFSREPDDVNIAEGGKRPRSFVAPMIVADEGRPVLGIGSPGGRRIPVMIAEVLIAWADGHGLQQAVDRPRFHLEGRRLQLEEAVPDDVWNDLAARGYEITTQVPTTEYFGGIQALMIDHDAREIDGVADTRRPGNWEWAAAGG